MSVEIVECHEGKVLKVRATGKLEKQDYELFMPEIERLIKIHGKVMILFDMHDFHGWKMGAMWEDLKFDVKHYRDIERLAVVGESQWEKWMTAFCRPFTSATIRYFSREEAGKARDWLLEGLPTSSCGEKISSCE